MRHRFHALCPYFAMFPEAFAEHWIAELTQEGDLVLDPFCGRGTVPFQALIMRRRAVACDINPVAYCVTRAKTNAPSVSSLRRRITMLQERFVPHEWEAARRRLPRFFRVAYVPSTLRQILYCRDALRWRQSNVDCMLAALVLGALHGESQRSSSYLSNQMPRTISTKPDYSVRYWEKHRLKAPQRDVFELLRRLVPFRYASEPPEGTAQVFLSDFRELPRNLKHTDAKPRVAVTSPPYLDTTNFEEDQWLRLWFLGYSPTPTYGRISKDDRHATPSTYWCLIADMWRVLGRVLGHDAYVVIRMGGKKLLPREIVTRLEATSSFAGRDVKLLTWEVSEIKRRQTDSFRPGSSGCKLEVDCCFRLG